MLTVKKAFKEKYGQINVYYSSWEHEYFLIFQKSEDAKEFLEKMNTDDSKGKWKNKMSAIRPIRLIIHSLILTLSKLMWKESNA
jgi:hypothetical protein